MPQAGTRHDAFIDELRDAYDIAEGRLFVRFNGSGCHGGRAGGGMGPSLRDVDWIYGREDARIYSSIAEVTALNTGFSKISSEPAATTSAR